MKTWLTHQPPTGHPTQGHTSPTPRDTRPPPPLPRCTVHHPPTSAHPHRPHQHPPRYPPSSPDTHKTPGKRPKHTPTPGPSPRQQTATATPRGHTSSAHIPVGPRRYHQTCPDLYHPGRTCSPGHMSPTATRRSQPATSPPRRGPPLSLPQGVCPTELPAKPQVRGMRDRKRDRKRDRSRLSATATTSLPPTQDTPLAHPGHMSAPPDAESGHMSHCLQPARPNHRIATEPIGPDRGSGPPPQLPARARVRGMRDRSGERSATGRG